jgi:hypothetical protein
MSDRQPWELTDKEAEQALLDGIDACYGKPHLWTTKRANQVIATAAQKKLVEWLQKKDVCESYYFHEGGSSESVSALMFRGDLKVYRADWLPVKVALGVKQ